MNTIIGTRTLGECLLNRNLKIKLWKIISIQSFITNRATTRIQITIKKLYVIISHVNSCILKCNTQFMQWRIEHHLYLIGNLTLVEELVYSHMNLVSGQEPVNSDFQEQSQMSWILQCYC